MGKTYFEHKNLHRYPSVIRGQDAVEIKSMIDLVVVKKDILRYVQDVRAMRGMGRGLSNHHVVLCKVGIFLYQDERGSKWGWEA